MIEQLIARVFYTRNVAHWSHWRASGVGSYAEHYALGQFYDAIIGDLDAIVEAYQGAFGLVGTIPASEVKGGTILSVLEDDSAWLDKNCDTICRGNRAIANLLDGLGARYLSAIYKLKNLK